jgi:pyrimidine-nucleoside phosphorylase
MKFKNLIDTVSKSSTEENMFRLISFAETKTIHNDDIAYLAEVLANSGQRISFKKKSLTADIPSTGGPSSLSTILCPLMLVEFGFKVPKVSVPGSPAGGIDVLSQIDSYQIHFSRREFESLISKNEFVHSIADDIFCPLDILLFKFRKKINKLNVFPLVIASLLSKKIALGVRFVGLDVRVSEKGNFGIDFAQARENSQRFNDVAKLLDINSKCFLTDVRFPLQPYIGRGESLIATHEILEGKISTISQSHFNTCLSMAIATTGKKAKNEISIMQLKNGFQRNLTTQGSSYKKFFKRVSEIKCQNSIPIVAKKSGFVNIDLQKLKFAIVEEQKKAKKEFADPCGCTLNFMQGNYVRKGDVIATVRIESESKSPIFPKFKKAFSVNHTITKTEIYEEVI